MYVCMCVAGFNTFRDGVEARSEGSRITYFLNEEMEWEKRKGFEIVFSRWVGDQRGKGRVEEVGYDIDLCSLLEKWIENGDMLLVYSIGSMY